jgi:hypothetical protein
VEVLLIAISDGVNSRWLATECAGDVTSPSEGGLSQRVCSNDHAGDSELTGHRTHGRTVSAS